jgi:pyridoxine 5-phosphate synthase
VAADPVQIEASKRVGAAVVELHTGAYCDYHDEGNMVARDAELGRIAQAAVHAHGLGLEVHAGHGLSYGSVGPIAALPEVMELNIGHFLMGEAIFRGLPDAMAEMRRLMDAARVQAKVA